MSEQMNHEAFLAALSAKSDDALHEVIGKARALLAAREDERTRQAVAEIKRIARANGLRLTAKKNRKRGRPPKAA